MTAAALLLCDHVDPDQQQTFGDYPEMFAALFPEWCWTSYDCVNGEFPNDLQRHEVYLISGSRHSAYDNLPWIQRLKETIRQLHQRKQICIGVCFGHQLIAEALGGRVQPSPQGWCVGVHTFEILQKMSWMSTQRVKINLLMMCQDQVSTLPEGAIVLAKNKLCPIGMYQMDKHILAVQAHPEFSKDYDQYLMLKRKNRIGSEIFERAITSFAQTVDQSLIKEWILQFVQEQGK